MFVFNIQEELDTNVVWMIRDSPYSSRLSPQAEQENELLLKENRELRSQMRLLGETVARLEADGGRMVRHVAELQEFLWARC